MEDGITTATTTTFLLLLLLTFVSVPPSNAQHNITSILAHFPEYSIYNSFLSQTKVADEINSRETLTCLVLANPTMSTLAAKRPLSAVKNALRLLTLLDYYDSAKLHSIPHGTVLTTTLLQTTGAYNGNLGFVNITDLRGGRVGFGSTVPGSKLDATYTKSVKQLPYSISVLEISAPITFPGLLDAPVNDNITAILIKAGCKTFSSLLVSSGVLRVFQNAIASGLTVFAPNDEAFKADDVPAMNKLSQAELVTLLEYHAIPEYAPKATLKATKGRHLRTLASSGSRRFELSVVSTGDDVSLRTGLDSSRVASTVLDDPLLCILTVDSVLLPIELFGNSSSPAPASASTPAEAPASSSTPTPTPIPSSSTPSPAPIVSAKAPAPEKHSHPAPPSDSSEASPADAPEDGPADAVNDDEGAATRHVGCLVSLVSGCVIVGLFSLTWW